MINIKDHVFDYGEKTKSFWKEGENYKELDDAINVSIEKAYKDIMVRTLNVKESRKSTDIIENLKESNFKSHIKAYFDKGFFPEGCITFDDFHNTLCKSAIELLVKKYNNVKYGKAQKLVNMTFKYLYCTKYVEENNKKDLFKCCHIALDSIILEWLYKYVYDIYEIDNNQQLCKNNSNKHKLTRDNTPSWSNLTYSIDKNLIEDGKYTYNFYIQIIKQYFKDTIAPYKNITPFEAEFIIWREMQMELASEAFYSSLQKYLYGSDTKIKELPCNTSVTDKLNSIKDLL